MQAMFRDMGHRFLNFQGGNAMTCCLFAIGKQGIHSCHAILDAAMAGILNDQELQIVLVGAEEQQAETLQGLIHDYHVAREKLQSEDVPGFSCTISIRVMPEAGLDASLQERCETEADKLLLNCLFAKERMLRRSAASSMETAQAAWADFLEDQQSGDIWDCIRHLDAEDMVLVTGSLTETLTAGGCSMVLQKISSLCHAAVGAVLSLPLHRSDRTDLIRGALKEMPDIDAVYLYGLPEDLRTEADGMDELVGLRCMDHFLHGGRGVYTYAQTMDVPTWTFFGNREKEYRERVTALLHISALMMLQYGPDALERLERSATGYVRGWFGRVYGNIRKDPEAASAERQVLRSVLHLLRFHMAWCYLVTGNLPLPLRYQAQLQEAQKKASAHYDDVLNVAGRLALLSHDVEKSGILEEETVHRASMEDTEGEAARKKVVEMAEKLQELAGEQTQYEEILGGRAAFMLLEMKYEEAEKEAEHLREQAEEAMRRIEEAAQAANADELPKIDAARSRLGNLQRHLVFLEGRAAYAKRDVEKARSESERNRKPNVEFTADTEPDVLFDRHLLRAMISVYDKQSAERRRKAEELIASVQGMNLQHVADNFDRIGQDVNGTAGMIGALYRLWKQEYSGR